MKLQCHALQDTVVRKLNIIGAGGHGAVCAEIAYLNGYTEIVFYDDAYKNIPTQLGYSVENTLYWVYDNIQKNEDYIVAIGNNTIRQTIFYKLQSLSANIVNLIHPKAIVSPFCKMGLGNVLCGGSFLGVQSNIANACIINSISSVDHDCTLEDAVHICPGSHIAGGCILGQRSWLGIGSTVKECMIVGSDVFVGAGAVVVSNLSANETYVGIPARKLNRKL